MKNCFFLFVTFVFLLQVSNITAQDKGATTIYDPAADARKELNRAISDAQASNRHVLVMIGGNW